jgi:tripartite-type tricarboxylate transporter receptor subunit TctC
MNAHLPRRRLLAAAIAAPLAAPRPGRAAAFPDRPIRLIIPWAAGGSTDAQMRVFAEIAARHLGQPLVLENRPGARGTLGAQLLLQAKPDGYTLSQIHSGVFTHPFMTKAAMCTAERKSAIGAAA